ncbi:hypothetical protein HDG34_003231 [Paraburkholderia sp. HC6.4b]|nr:hypothetical protein [Paraburkholderia sp. HC6.4b]MBB5451018.1 hypothetical protein [Paraburkholderia sp. Kb1A]
MVNAEQRGRAQRRREPQRRWGRYVPDPGTILLLYRMFFAHCNDCCLNTSTLSKYSSFA